MLLKIQLHSSAIQNKDLSVKLIKVEKSIVAQLARLLYPSNHISACFLLIYDIKAFLKYC